MLKTMETLKAVYVNDKGDPTYLDLSYQQLTTLPQYLFEKQQKINILDISGNKISSIPIEAFNISLFQIVSKENKFLSLEEIFKNNRNINFTELILANKISRISKYLPFCSVCKVKALGLSKWYVNSKVVIGRYIKRIVVHYTVCSSVCLSNLNKTLWRYFFICLNPESTRSSTTSYFLYAC